MNHMFSIYVPSTKHADQPIDNTRYVNRVAKLLSRHFGGASWEQISGAWYSDDKNKLIIETITRVWAYSPTNNEFDRQYVESIAGAVKDWLQQESVAFEAIEYPVESGLMFT